jgi:membrane-bound metal-dependent hydrolase YbcI (DUF457 family)
MFVGHYGVSFACKGVEQRLPLWLLFLAVQLVDILWSILILLGIEKVRIVPGITATNPFDLYYMPYTHSLVAAVVWSALVFLGYRMFLSQRSASRDRPALFLALAVFSHWILDLLVHRPDLPLYGNTHKVGLGLWNYPMPAFALEAAILFGGMWVYMRSTKSGSFFGEYGMPIFGIVLLLVHWILFFGPPAPSPDATAILLLVLYLGFAAIAAWLERKRQVRAM